MNMLGISKLFPKSMSLRWLVVLAAVVAIGLPAGLYVRHVMRVPRIPSPDLEGADPAIAEAIESARRQVEDKPGSSSAWGRLGMVLLVHKFANEALACLNRAAQMDRAEARWPYYQAFLLSGEAAARKLRKAVELSGGGADAPRLELAERLLTQDRLPEAEAEFQIALKLQPKQPRALLGLGQIAFQRGDLKACKDYLIHAVASEPDLKRAHLLLAQVRHREGDLEGAEKERRRAAEILVEKEWPDTFLKELNQLETGREAIMLKAAKLLRERRPRAALALLEPAAERYADSELVWTQLSNARYQLRQYAGSEEASRKAIQLAPTSSWAHYRLGLAQAAQKKRDAAEASLRRAIELKPDDPVPHYTLGFQHARAFRWDDARQGFENALRYKADHVDAHVELAQVCVVLGDGGKAWNHVRQALLIQPKNVKANRLLLRLLVGSAF